MRFFLRYGLEQRCILCYSGTPDALVVLKFDLRHAVKGLTPPKAS
jgi:hypothetical protein